MARREHLAYVVEDLENSILNIGANNNAIDRQLYKCTDSGNNDVYIGLSDGSLALLVTQDSMSETVLSTGNVTDTEGIVGGGTVDLQDILDELSEAANYIPIGGIPTNEIVFGGASNELSSDVRFKWDGERLTLRSDGNVYIGENAALNRVGIRSNYIGYRSGYYTLANGDVTNYSNGFGYHALSNNTGVNSNGFGYHALSNNTGVNSNGFGYLALRDNTGSNSNGFGYLALRDNTGSNSNGFGYYALRDNTGVNSNGFGYYAGYLNEGDDVIGIGTSAIRSNTQDGNIGIGKEAFYNNTLYANSIILGNNLSVTKSNQVVIGGASHEHYIQGVMGIKTDSPTKELDINGELRVRGTTQDNALTDILVEDSDGVVHSRELSSLPYDNYQNWKLFTNGVQRTSINSEQKLDLVAGTGITNAYGAGGAVTHSFDTAWGDGRYLQSFTETDPTVPSHVKAITTGNITNWDTAYNWGDHSTEGYLTGIDWGNIGGTLSNQTDLQAELDALDNYQKWIVSADAGSNIDVESTNNLFLQGGTLLSTQTASSRIIFNVDDDLSNYDNTNSNFASRNDIDNAVSFDDNEILVGTGSGIETHNEFQYKENSGVHDDPKNILYAKNSTLKLLNNEVGTENIKSGYFVFNISDMLAAGTDKTIVFYDYLDSYINSEGINAASINDDEVFYIKMKAIRVLEHSAPGNFDYADAEIEEYVVVARYDNTSGGYHWDVVDTSPTVITSCSYGFPNIEFTEVTLGSSLIHIKVKNSTHTKALRAKFILNFEVVSLGTQLP